MQMGTLEAVKKADVKALCAIKGISQADARSIVEHFQSKLKQIKANAKYFGNKLHFALLKFGNILIYYYICTTK